MRNKLIVFEGIDGAGKSTQVALLARTLRARGVRVTVFDIPRYASLMGKLIKESLMGKYGDFLKVSPYLASLPYALDRAAATPRVMRALERGVVICNRYTPSNIAFQGAKIRNAGERSAFARWCETLEYRELGIPKPDRIILLDTPPATAQQLMSKKKKDQHEKAVQYQKHVADFYRQLAKGTSWRRVECFRNGEMLPPNEIHELVMRSL